MGQRCRGRRECLRACPLALCPWPCPGGPPTSRLEEGEAEMEVGKGIKISEPTSKQVHLNHTPTILT